ncbi:hypothetical protein [Bacillus rubiinfantis]|uniref:hypothetical protein n=1 Tax=Bacillus rubiinfantis TaxID=1499680 RepID=UPI0005A736CF|nr:hypothetical protein [Bacillus rubiinfantis]
MNPYDYYYMPSSSVDYHSYLPLDQVNPNPIPEYYDPNRQPQQLERRVSQLERQSGQQQREINQLNREVDRLGRRLQRVNQRLRAVERRLNIPFTPFDGEF